MRPIQTYFLTGLMAFTLMNSPALAQTAPAEPVAGASAPDSVAEPAPNSVAEPSAGEASEAEIAADSSATGTSADAANPGSVMELLELTAEERSPGPFAAEDIELSSFLWQNRVLVIFADTEQDLNFLRQMDLIAARMRPLNERGVIVLTDTDPAGRNPIRTKLRPRGFAAVLVDKDGRVISRRPSPWDVREIERTIDSTPLRLQELRERRDAIDPIRGGAR